MVISIKGALKHSPSVYSTLLYKTCVHFSPAAEVGNPASFDKVFSLFFGVYAITSRSVWSSYPWAIKNIQDGCRKTGQICDGDVYFW